MYRTIILLGILLAFPLSAGAHCPTVDELNFSSGRSWNDEGGLAEELILTETPVHVKNVGVGWKFSCIPGFPGHEGCEDITPGTAEARVEFDIVFYAADGLNGGPGTPLQRISTYADSIKELTIGEDMMLHKTDISDLNIIFAENPIYVGVVVMDQPPYYLLTSTSGLPPAEAEGTYISDSFNEPITWVNFDQVEVGRSTNICTEYDPVESALEPPGPIDTSGCSALDPDKPTVVLTHGLQDDDVDPDTELWTGYGPMQAAQLIENVLGDAVNICQYIWEGAFQDHGIDQAPDREAYLAARENIGGASRTLADTLLAHLGTSYDEPIHFIGHSLGVPVNAYGAFRFLEEATQVDQVQFTALDRPDHIRPILGISTSEEHLYNYDEDFLHDIVFMLTRPVTEKRVENYYSFNLEIWTAGVGDVATGVVYNHADLKDPGRLDTDLGFEEGVNNDHSGVHQWYRWTIDPTITAPAFPGIPPCVDGAFNPDFVGATGFDETLNPCSVGWHWSQNMNPDDFPSHGGNTGTILEQLLTDTDDFVDFGCTVNAGTLTCSESAPLAGAGPLWAGGNVSFTEDLASYVRFEYRFSGSTDGEYVAVAIDGDPVWVLSGATGGVTADFQDSGPIAVGTLTGNYFLNVLLFSVGAPGATLEVRNIEFITRPALIFADGFESGDTSVWE